MRLFTPRKEPTQYNIQYAWNKIDKMILVTIQPSTNQQGVTMDHFLLELKQQINQNDQRVFWIISNKIPPIERNLLKNKINALKTGEICRTSKPLPDRIVYDSLSKPIKMKSSTLDKLEKLKAQTKVITDKNVIVSSYLPSLQNLAEQAYWIKSLKDRILKQMLARIQQATLIVVLVQGQTAIGMVSIIQAGNLGYAYDTIIDRQYLRKDYGTLLVEQLRQKIIEHNQQAEQPIEHVLVVRGDNKESIEFTKKVLIEQFEASYFKDISKPPFDLTYHNRGEIALTLTPQQREVPKEGTSQSMPSVA